MTLTWYSHQSNALIFPSSCSCIPIFPCNCFISTFSNLDWIKFFVSHVFWNKNFIELERRTKDKLKAKIKASFFQIIDLKKGKKFCSFLNLRNFLINNFEKLFKKQLLKMNQGLLLFFFHQYCVLECVLLALNKRVLF